MLQVIIFFTWLLATAGGHQILDFPDTVDQTICIPLSRLQDASVQRGLGELRKIKKVNLYLTGNDTVDVTVAVATSFRNEDFTKPLLQKCENYKGAASDVLVSMTCRQSVDVDGIYGYAVFVKFFGDFRNNSAAICQLEIHLGEKDAEEIRAKKQSTAITFGVTCCLFVLAGISVIIWYRLTTREIPLKNSPSLPTDKKPQRAMSTKEDDPSGNEDDYYDDVFVLE